MNAQLNQQSDSDIWISDIRPSSDRRACGNLGCTGGIFTFLKDRRRPIFEDRWGCTSECVQTLVEKAVRRETADGLAGDSLYQHRVPLGLIMLKQNWITQAQLRRALHMQRENAGPRIGSWLVSQCGLNQQHVTRALGMQWQCPVLSIEDCDPQRMALSAPPILIEQCEMAPLKITGKRVIHLGFEDHIDAAACLAVERMSGFKVQPGLLTADQMREARRRLAACDAVETKFAQVCDVEVMARNITLAILKAQPRAARLVRVHEMYWLRMWLEAGAMTSHEGGLPTSSQDIADRIFTVSALQ